MELLCYITIMLVMAAISGICAWLDGDLFSVGPVALMGYIAGAVAAIMFVALVIGGIMYAFGVGVSA